MIVNYFNYVIRNEVVQRMQSAHKIAGDPNIGSITFDLKINEISLPFIVEQIHSFIEENNI